MPSDRLLELVGGPLDGHRVRKAPGRVAWVRGVTAIIPDGDRPPLRHREGQGAQARPATGRALYMLSQGADGTAAYLYAGHRRYLCGCGAYHEKVEGGSERPPCVFGARA